MILANVRNLVKRISSINLIKRCYCLNTVNSQANILVKFLGLKTDEAVRYVLLNGLKRMESHRLTAMLKFMTKQNYPKDEILKYPILFKYCNGRTWEHYYYYLEECGCVNITIKDILIFRKLTSLPISDLKKCKLIPEEVVVAEELIKHIKYLPNDFFIGDLKDDNLKLSYIHDVILKRFYLWFFECSEDDILTMLRIHHGETKCFKYICENIDMALSLGYSKNRIRGNAYILLKHPAYTKEVLEEMPHFAGGNMRKSLRHYPKLIGISKQHILKVYNLIKEHNFSDEQVRFAMNVFTLSYKTVYRRLNGLKNDPEIKLLCYDKKILSLIIHYNRGHRRMQILKENKLKCNGVHLIALKNTNLDKEINCNQDIHAPEEIGEFIKSLLNTTDNKVVDRFKRHPFYLHVPFMEIQRTHKFLKKSDFKNNQLCLVPQVLLYPKEKIKEVLDLIYSKDYENTPILDCLGYQRLNVILYLLEKNYHFTGNGIWANNVEQFDE